MPPGWVRPDSLLPWVALVVACYLLGSFPSAYLAGRFRRKGDIRALGDRNPGAANAWQVLGAPIGAGVALVDIAKGIGTVLVARAILAGEGAALLGGIAAVMGHNWPFFLRFRGGRGAATALGVLVALLPKAAVPLGLAALIPILLTRSTMVGFVFIFVPLPLAAWWWGYPTYQVAYSVAMPLVVAAGHYLSVRRVARVAHSN